MLALLLSAGILIYLSCIGVAVASLFARKMPLAVLLTSPSIGLGVLIPTALTFNRAGLPISAFGVWLVLSLAVIAAAIFRLRRPVIPWRDVVPALPWIGIGALLAGFPMLMYGFHWASNSNGDMGIYVSSASNLLHHGFFSVPALNEIVRGTDAARSWWFWEILPPNRYGTDVLLAIVAATVHLDTYLVYMPCGVAAFVALIMATGALCANKPMRRTMFVAMALMAVACPLMLFTVYQQILPQLLGQVALVGIVALVQLGDEDRAAVTQRGVALGCAVNALAYIYPETSPVLIAGAVATIPFAFYRHVKCLPEYARGIGSIGGIAAVVVLILQNVQIFTFLASMRILLAIVAAVSGTIGPGVLNYYLIPSGFANLWGLLPFDYYNEPVLSVCIVVGAILFLAFLIGGIRNLFLYGRFSDGMLVALLLQFAYLVVEQISYSSYKTAYVLQPFWIPLAAVFIMNTADGAVSKYRIPQRWIAGAAIAVCCLVTAYSTVIYAGSSADLFSETSARYVELHAASSDNVYGTIGAIAAKYSSQKQKPFRVDGVFNQAMVRIIAIALRGHALEFEDIDPLAHVAGTAGSDSAPILRIRNIPGWPARIRAKSWAAITVYDRLFAWRPVSLFKRRTDIFAPPRERKEQKSFSSQPRPFDEGLMVQAGPQISVLNRSWATQNFSIRAVPWREVHHWLGFVNSTLGTAPVYGTPVNAFGQVEPDPYYPNGPFMATLGKTMMLEVMNDREPTVQLLLDLSATFNPRPHVIIPTIMIAGESRVTLSNIGVGSARIITPPVRPLNLFGRRYIVLYFGQGLYKFAPERSWLMNLYGRNVDLDPRYFALFTRNISIAPPLGDAPKQLAELPRDLRQPGLLYSGVYEDGWLGRRFSVRLRSDIGDQLLHLRVNVPPTSMQQVVSVTIDGRPVAALEVKPSTYLDLSLPWSSPGNHTVLVQATDIDKKVLVNDSRPTWGRLMQIGFQ